MPIKSNEEHISEKEKLPISKNREEIFVRNLFLYPSVYEAGIQAGYTEDYAKSGLYQRLKSKKFQNKIREYAIQHDIIDLPKIAYIESKVLDHLAENPLDLPKFRHTLTEKKRIAGVLQADFGEKQPVVRIENVRNLMIRLNEKARDNSTGSCGEAVDAEI